MIKYIIKRIFQGILALFILCTLIFFLFRLLPADPTAALLDGSLDTRSVERIIERFGLDLPLYKQYYIYLKNIILEGDFGISFFYRKSVIEILKSKILNTIVLTFPIIIFSYFFGMIVGAMMAWKRGKLFEISGIIFSLVFRAAPQFWMGMISLMLFAFHFRWFPSSGMREIGYEVSSVFDKYISLDFLHHLILPVTVGVLHIFGKPALLMRNSLLDVMNEPYIEMATAKGLSEWRILFVHAARNALLPVSTNFATAIGRAIGGIVMIEYVFSWPGIGREIVLSATRYDYPLAQAAFLMLATIIIIMNIIADILYSFLDPRIVYK